MPSCQELTRLIASDELAGAERPVRLKAWLHLLMCRHCRRYAEQIRAIAAAARRSWRPDTDESTGLARLEAEILERCFDERSRVTGESTRPLPDEPDPDETANS